MASEIFLRNEARNKLLSGVTKLNDVIRGPMGNYILFDKSGPNIINDVVTIASEIKFNVKAEDLGVGLIINISKRTDEF